MNGVKRLCAFLAILVVCFADAAPRPKKIKKDKDQSPPPPVIVQQEKSDSLIAFSTLLPADEYSIGAPTDEEQLFVEYINRARADAGAEAIRLANTDDLEVLSAISSKNVDLIEMLSQFTILEQHLPPLSIHSILTEAARLHSLDMFDAEFDGHVSSSSPPSPFNPGDTLGQRIDHYPSYSYSVLAENVFIGSKSVFYGHAAFEINWGGNTWHGMQEPPGHRYNIHQYFPVGNYEFREIGVGGVKLGTKTVGDKVFGPIVVTQVFGSQQSTVPFITGVAYYDLNQNSFYDLGEGLGGFTVEIAEGPAWAETADSGGYSIPVTVDGTYTVTFSGLQLTPDVSPVLITGGNNTKHDLILNYVAPQMIGTAYPVVSSINTYVVTPTPGATSYKVREWSDDATAWSEGAENGTTGLIITKSDGYIVIQSALVQTGLYSFHLAHPIPFETQIVEINETFLPTSTSEIRFQSKLGYASEDQFAQVDVSTDGGLTWTNLYSQPGTNGSGESTFSEKIISLSSYANVPINIRFKYLHEGYDNGYYNQITTNFGWVFDEITVTNSSRITLESESTITSHSYNFVPSTTGTFHLTAQPFNNSRPFSIGPATTVTAGTSTAIEIWRTGHFSGTDLADPSKEATVWGNDADPEKDGLSNLMEFALNGDPNLPDAGSILPQPTQSGDSLTLQYTKYRNEVTYSVMTSDDMESTSWSTTGVTLTPDPLYSPEGTVINASAPIGTDKKVFLELDVTMP